MSAAGVPRVVLVLRLCRGRSSKVATICEVGLIPGDDALLAPEWVPWADRLQASERDNNGAEEAGTSAEDNQDVEDTEEV